MPRISTPPILLLASLLLAFPAQAARWVSLGNVEKGQARLEVDAGSLVKADGGKIRLWHRETYATPRMPESGAFTFSRLTALSEFNCDKRTAAPIELSYATASGNELKTENFDARNAQAISPDSTLEKVFGYACKPPSKAAAAKPAVAAAPAPAPEPAPVVETKAAEKKTKKNKKDEEEKPHSAPHWSYSGATGADKWGSMDKEFATCGLGQRQSPIDIRNTVRADLPAIQFAYKPVPLSIVDNGHSVKVDTPGAGSITVDGESYDLVQFHFHKPSEEKINGKLYDMVVHLVHQAKDGRLAVVGVMIEAGKEQPLIRTLWTHLPLEQNKPIIRENVKINPAQLIPAKQGYYTFLGSLTTPPCSEGVLWLVLKTPLQISKEQLADFGTLYKNNVRPLQPVNGRLIKESR